MDGGNNSSRHIAADVRPALLPKARLQIDRVSNESILLYPEGVLELNVTGAAIVALCDGQHTFQAMLRALAAIYQISPDALREDVEEFLHGLCRESLLEFRVDNV